MDTYTKGILTIIAIVLVSISFQLSQTNLIKNAKASGDCGEVRYSPCYVKVINDVRTLPQK